MTYRTGRELKINETKRTSLVVYETSKSRIDETRAAENSSRYDSEHFERGNPVTPVLIGMSVKCHVDFFANFFTGCYMIGTVYTVSVTRQRSGLYDDAPLSHGISKSSANNRVRCYRRTVS